MSRSFRLTMPQPSEWSEQASLFRWAAFVAASRWPELHLMYAIPNGAYLVDGPRQGQQLKETGLKPGVLDICLPVPRGGYHGLYVEMKRRHGGRVSEDQTWWIEALQAMDYRTEAPAGWDAARLLIEQYMAMEPAHEPFRLPPPPTLSRPVQRKAPRRRSSTAISAVSGT